MQQHGAQRISDLFTLRKSSIPSDPEYLCGPPDNFGFAGGLHPARSIRYTDMCVADFNYPSLRVNQNDNQYTSNAPGAVLMWNTSYSTWIRARRGIAHTQLFKYRSQNGGYFLDYISQVDLPSTLRVSVYVTVETSHGSRSASGTTHTSATIGRTGGRGTRSHHSAIIAGVSRLPNQHKID